MKIRLINVSIHKAIDFSMKKRIRASNYPSLGLMIIAALTPAEQGLIKIPPYRNGTVYAHNKF